MTERIGRRAMLRGLAAGAAASMVPLSAWGSELGAAPSETAASAAPGKPFRFVHLSDIHVQPELRAAAGMTKCLAAVESLDPKPDLIVTGGDLIMDAFAQDEARSKMLFELYKKVLADHTGIPVRQCIGNHDIFGWANKKGVTPAHPQYGKKMVCEMLELPQTYYAFDAGGWRFYILDDIQPTEDHRYEAYLDEPQRAWLEEQLRQKDPAMPAAVVCHIPILSVTAMDVASTFRDGVHAVPSALVCRDAHDLAHLLAKHNVRLALSGHMHMVDRVDYRGVTYICDGAVSGGWWKGEHRGFHEGFGVIDLAADGTLSHKYHQYGWQAVPA
ncbi:MAG: metallophosphoesterase family protein [Planctomycetota bacterium]